MPIRAMLSERAQGWAQDQACSMDGRDADPTLKATDTSAGAFDVTVGVAKRAWQAPCAIRVG